MNAKNMTVNVKKEKSGRDYIAEKSVRKTENLLKTMPEFVKMYYYSISAHEPTSCYEYLNKVSLLIKHIASIKGCDTREVTVNDITFETITSYLKEKSNSVSKNTWSMYKKGLSRFLDFLCSNSMIETNYVKTIATPRKHRIERKEAPTVEELKKIMSTINDENNGLNTRRADIYGLRNKVIMMLLMTTGIRKSALCSINISDINFEEKMIYIIDKGDKADDYDISPIMDLLYKWLDKRRETIEEWEANGEELSDDVKSALFITNRRCRIDAVSISIIVKKISVKAIGRALKAHELRAAFCTILYEQTKDINLTKERMHHSNIETTMIYLRSNKKENAVKATNAMAGALGL